MITGWADDLGAEIAEKFNAKLGEWRDGLYALDVETERLNYLQEYAALDPESAAEWQSQSDRVSFFAGTINAVGNAIESIRGYVSNLGSSAKLAGVPALGLIPAIPAATLAIITGGVVALGALVYSIKSFNDRITSQHLTEINADLVREGKTPLTLPGQADLMGNLSQIVQWGVIGAIALLVYRQIGVGKR